MKTTGKVSWKQYKCTRCNHIHSVQTNHCGDTYGRCPNCSWKYPLEPNKHVCIEPLSDSFKRPEPWKIATIEVVK